MKKLFCLLLMIITFGLINTSSYAVESPQYDETYNYNQGAFFANGTPIVISEVDGKTVITWNGGSQTVPNTVSVFGGGNGGNYASSQITMESGTVQNIIGGGIGYSADNASTVTTSNIIINNGIISNAVTGGGYFNAQVDISNIQINGGSAISVQGGGMASGKINGVNYSVGNKEDAINSPNRTNIANVTISEGKIISLLFGGGQGISYTGTANLVISGGDMSNAYVTAGGSNGYTKNVNVKLTGGKIGVYQTVNRGTLNNATIKVAGTTIDKFYVGGETEDKSVTGILNNINLHLVGGNIQTLNSGTSNGAQIIIDNETYKINMTDDIQIKNDNIESSKNHIDYDFTIPSNNIKLSINQNMKINPIITTTPYGYENVFIDLFSYTSNDQSIVTVNNNGIIKGISEGSTSIIVKNGNKTKEINVTVTNLQTITIGYFALIISILLLFSILFAFLYLGVL